MPSIPDDLHQRLKQHGQDHVLSDWDRLSPEEQQTLLGQLQSLDLELLRKLFAQQGASYPVPASDKIKPVPVLARKSPDDDRDRKRGEEALRAGQVAALVVAGGQGSRLGFDQPKGMFPVGPVTQNTLFQIHAEKVLAVRRRYSSALPLLVMTSPATDAETRRYFAEQKYFGLPIDEVIFFCQGTMPALDLASGKLLREAPGRLFLGPDGHGGTLRALKTSGLLDKLQQRGIQHLFYFQVDNPLVKIADPVFLGQHIEHRAEMSSKVIPKLGPTDKLGNFVQVDGRCTMIEYSDLPEELARQTDADGRPRLWAGNPAIHVFDRDFLARMTLGDGRMPFHLARKKVPYLDDNGKLVQPERENALKFELFIFDVLPLAERWLLVETSREEEFAPLKNAKGADSAEAVAQAMTRLAAEWLKAAGVAVPRWPDGNPAVALEISPLLALDAGELAARLKKPITINGPQYLGE
jgi:UDP-N-acetylglucosamine/UDP-N-acetylgalactosamine diphosphorylase